MSPKRESALVHPEGRSFVFTSKSVSFGYSFGTCEQIGSGNEVLRSPSTENRVTLSMEGVAENSLERQIYHDAAVNLFGSDHDIPPFTPEILDIGHIGYLSVAGDDIVLAEVEVPQRELRTIVAMFASGYSPNFTFECAKNPKGVDGADWLVERMSVFRRIL